MRIVVWGLGYVGTVSAACFTCLGHEVVGVEPNLVKVNALNDGHSAIKEPGLDELVREGVSTGRLRATQHGAPLVGWADLSLICVGTPEAADGTQQPDYVRVVVSQKRPEFVAALQALDDRIAALDLVHLSDAPTAASTSKYRGLSW